MPPLILTLLLAASTLPASAQTAQTPPQTELRGIKQALAIEQFIDHHVARTNVKLPYDAPAYQAILQSLDRQIAQITDPLTLYITKVIIYENWLSGELGYETPKGCLLSEASTRLLMQLVKQKHHDTHHLFKQLQRTYATDAGASLLYKELEQEYFPAQTQTQAPKITPIHVEVGGGDKELDFDKLRNPLIK